MVATLVAAADSTGVIFPLSIAAVVLIMGAAVGIARQRLSQYSLLPRLMILVYVLPFTTLLGYVANDNFRWGPTPRALELSDSHLFVSRTLALGAVGLCGLLAGLLVARTRPSIPLTSRHRSYVPLSLVAYLTAYSIAVVLGAVSSSPDSILQVAYGAQRESSSNRLNLQSGAMVSLVILLWLLLDLLRDQQRKRRQLKTLSWLAGVTVVVVYYQLLRGNRASAGFMVAVVVIWLRNREHDVSRQRVDARGVRRRVAAGSLAGVGVFAAFAALGAVRTSLAHGAKVGGASVVVTGLKNGTWNAILATNLAVAAGRQAGLGGGVLWGRTYADYALSLPPGVVSKVVGFKRPLESTRGPAWWAQQPGQPPVSLGGIHISLVPYRNFGYVGAFVILSMYGYLIGRVERHASRDTFVSTMWLGSFYIASFYWFWYGDLYLIRIVLATAGVLWLARKRSRTRSSRAFP